MKQDRLKHDWQEPGRGKKRKERNQEILSLKEGAARRGGKKKKGNGAASGREIKGSTL